MVFLVVLIMLMILAVIYPYVLALKRLGNPG